MTAAENRNRPASAARTAAALLALSAVLMIAAAVQRWLWLDTSVLELGTSVEDHMYDYVLPADPWVAIGSAAALYGAALLLVAGAFVALLIAVAPRGGAAAVAIAGAVLAAGPFAVWGVHGILSNVLGAPSWLVTPIMMFGGTTLGVLQLAGFVLLLVVAVRRSVALGLAVVALVGVTGWGYILASFVIAPMLVGYQSYDTTPWTEAIVAAAPLVAAGLLIAHAVRTGRRSTPAPTERAFAGVA